jgi:hypothetical protein
MVKVHIFNFSKNQEKDVYSSPPPYLQNTSSFDQMQ